MIAIAPRTPSTQLVRQERLADATQQIVQAPIGGWNTRDPLSAMEPLDAITLDNWIPGTGSIITRPGYSSNTTGFTGQVESLMEYDDGADQTFFAASSTKIQSFTEGGTPSDAVTGLTNARWQHVNFNGRLICTNGADGVRDYTNSGGWSTTSLTGPTSADLDGVNVFKNRVYYWDSSSQSFWYGGVNAYSGTFTEFPLNRVSQTGGSLLAMGNITFDGGDGVDDFACFVMSTGEVLLYQGDNPGDSSAWALQGRYRIPRPIQQVRCIVRYQGDLLILTESDIVSVLETIRLSGFNVNPSKISGAQQAAAAQYGNNYGWQAVAWPKGNLLLYNIPISNNTRYHQYVQNVVTGGYCRFTGMNARCFGVLGGELFFGGNQVVYKFDDGALDDATANIECTCQPAFSVFGIPNRKRFISGRFVFNSSASVSIASGVAIDYEEPATGQVNTSEATGPEWDAVDWDTVLWADEAQPQNVCFSINRQGVAISPKAVLSVSGARVNWYRTDYNFEVLRGF